VSKRFKYNTRAAAKSAGVDVTDAGVQSAGVSGDIGRNVYETWIAPWRKFGCGAGCWTSTWFWSLGSGEQSAIMCARRFKVSVRSRCSIVSR